MRRMSRSPRWVVFALGLLALTVVPVAGWSQAGTNTGSESAILTQDGWWNRAQGPQSSEPANPIRPAIGGVLPAPSTVPAKSIAVGALAGDPDKVAAVGFILDAPIDALVDRLTMTLKESTASGANANAAGAVIVACPITEFWAGVKNGDFVNRPVCDESLASPGARAADGTWKFDLSLMATSWLDPASGLAQNGVLLVEAVAAPTSFQVSFDDTASDNVKLDFATTGGGFSASSEFVPDESPTTTEPFVVAAPTTEPPNDFSAPVDTVPTLDTVPPEPEAAPTASPVATAAPVARTSPDPGGLFDNLPLLAMVLVGLLIAGAAVFVGLVLGPLAVPGATPSRAGGVSAALEARAAARP